ncbi:MAG: cysteine synthase [Actinomycetota bacterium]
MRYEDLIGKIGNTPLVELVRLSPRSGVRLWVKLESHNPTGSVKDRIAVRMIEEAERHGVLRPGTTVLEATSGNTGISLAMVCRLRGYPMVAVMPENTSLERRRLLDLFGAEVVLSRAAQGTNGAISMADRMIGEHRGWHMPYQFGNPANVLAHYEGTGPEIHAEVPEATHFVAGLGTGGTLMGVGRYLKEHNPNLKVISVEPESGDVVYGLRDLGAGYVPPILDQCLLDRRVKVGSRDSLRRTRELASEEGLFVGVSTGAALHVALRIAEKAADGSNIVVLSADGGWKYLSTGAFDADPERAQEAMQAHIRG